MSEGHRVLKEIGKETRQMLLDKFQDYQIETEKKVIRNFEIPINNQSTISDWRRATEVAGTKWAIHTVPETDESKSGWTDADGEGIFTNYFY